MQMDVALEWDDDETQVSYKKLGLHVGYNSNFQEFSLDDDYLQWQDGENCISVRFERTRRFSACRFGSGFFQDSLTGIIHTKPEVIPWQTPAYITP